MIKNPLVKSITADINLDIPAMTEQPKEVKISNQILRIGEIGNFTL